MIRKVACAVPLCFLLCVCDALADVVDLAAKLIGRPYVWGAEGPNSFDCSGLTQFVHEKIGIDLPRRAIDQSRIGDRVGGLQRGDLLFFSNDSRQSLVTHVGIYEAHGVMIDASKRHGRVRRDNLDDPFWAERFMFARRLNASTGGELPNRGRDRTADPPNRSSDKRRVAVRVLERIAGELFKIPR